MPPLYLHIFLISLHSGDVKINTALWFLDQESGGQAPLWKMICDYRFCFCHMIPSYIGVTKDVGGKKGILGITQHSFCTHRTHWPQEETWAYKEVRAQLSGSDEGLWYIHMCLKTLKRQTGVQVPQITWAPRTSQNSISCFKYAQNNANMQPHASVLFLCIYTWVS